jgi:hypothetical protein
MEPVASETAPTQRSQRPILVAFAVGAAVVALVLVRRHLRRDADDGVATLAEEGVLVLTDAIIDELFAS